MEMLRTFRITAVEKNTHAIRDFKYVDSYIVSGHTATVSYYDDEFTSLSSETIDLNTYQVTGCPNKTSRKDAYYKEKPLPSIGVLIPSINVTLKIPRKYVFTINTPAFTPVLPTISIAHS